LSLPEGIAVQLVGTEEAVQHLDELTALYREVYAEPPYEWGDDHADLFSKRFVGQTRDAGFTLVEARSGDELVGFGFGVTLAPTTPWWQNLLTPLPDEITHEDVGRTFALVELLVRKPWRRQYVAETIYNHLVQGRHEERATLTVWPAAKAAKTAYAKWGWRKVAQKRNPLPGSPLFDVLVKELRNTQSP
jgi:hypothetical protein